MSRKRMPSRRPPIVVAVDTGGTFTDIVVHRDGRLHALKLPSTPEDPARAVWQGIAQLVSPGEPFVLAHGSTVATNALLERRGARVVLVTNRDFEDLLEIGRQNRPQLYALVGTRLPPLVAREDRIGIAGRLDADGRVIEALDDDEVRGLVEHCRGAESIVVGFLHAYANPEHEARVARALESLDVPVTSSADLLPEFREYERLSTAAVNAYVAPIVRRYLRTLERGAAGEGAGHPAPTRIRIMGSAGGALSVARAAREPVHTILSGPAGGVVAALEVVRRAGGRRPNRAFTLSFDMGGTSTDVSLCPGRPLHTREYEIAQAAVAVPVIDIHTVGAGGGSIARVDPGGALRVGPQSAGAVPGPIAYGRGGALVTVTDAHVWLGRIPADAFLGGTSRLERDRIEGPLKKLADALDASPEEAAAGVIEVANTVMEGALRLISVERGYDPGSLTLVAFGGAAPLHACELAARLGVRRVLVPVDPGLLSARGILIADIRKDVSRTILRPQGRLQGRALERVFRPLADAAREELRAEGVPPRDVRIERWVDARYAGQSYELQVPATARWVDAFHRAHRTRYGFERPEALVEAVTARVTARAPVERPRPTRRPRGPRPTPMRHRAYPGERWTIVSRWDRKSLPPGHTLRGPAVITEYSATTWVPLGVRARVLPYGDLELTPARS